MPAILAENVDEFFEKPYCRSPFMTYTFQIKPDKRSVIPSVVHVDGSGRLQTVGKEDNKLFYELTGIPIVLNISFNLVSDPIACCVEDVDETFRFCDICVLVICNYFIS